MAYPPPPGPNSLPARPPVAANKHGFKSAAPSYPNATRHHAPSTGYPGDASAQQYPAAVAANNHGRSYAALPQSYPTAGQYSSSSYSNYPPATAAATNPSAQHGGYPYSSHQQSSYSSQNLAYGQAAYATPQIQNPFPAPGAVGSDFDPSLAAQIAEWQSAYVPRDNASAPASAAVAAAAATTTTTNTSISSGRDGKAAVSAELSRPEAAATASATQSEKKKTVVRQGGGKKWTDDTLLDWDPSHLRLFVGNLAGETTDESLLKAFSRWKSVQKARVIRDRRTTKSKGFGFVSFSDADDFFQAAKEMNGKYIQSHPVVVKKANTEIKVTNVKDKKDRSGKKSGPHRPGPGPVASAAITKPGQKTKNGLRLLG